jgi:ubiquinone/menaquinone biosynthesis C-methylase UbiE
MTDIKGAVQDKFSPAAANYSTSPIHAKGEDLQWMVELAALTGRERVLDLGCGAGHAALAFAPHVQQVVASDFTASMLDQVNKLAAERGLQNVETRHADAEKLPFDSASFDVVISRLSAHHWPHPQLAVNEAARVLKPGGQFILSDCVAPDQPAQDTFLQTFELLRDQSHVRDYGAEEWVEMFQAGGFEANVARRFEIFVEFTSWLARLATPDLNAAMIRKLFNDAPQEIRARFKIQSDYSFTLDCAIIHGKLR